MKKPIIRILTLIFVFVCFAPFNAKAIMTSLDISGDKLVYVNQSVNLKASFNMSNDLDNEDQASKNTSLNEFEDVTSKAVWTSSNDSVATVNDQGVVTGLKNGKVTISANYNDVTASYDITVAEDYNTSNNTNTDNGYDILTILTAVICPSIAMLASIAIIIVERKNNKNKKTK